MNDNEPTYMTAVELSTRWKGTISPRTLANWRVTGSGPRFAKAVSPNVVWCEVHPTELHMLEGTQEKAE